MKRFHLIFAIFTFTVLLNFQIAQVEATVTTPYMLPSGRGYTSAVWDGSNAYIFGGQYGPSDYLDDIVRFTPPWPVGGVVTPVNKLAIFAPCIALAGLIAAVSTVYIFMKRKD
jgi:hypothetical protein